MQRSVYSMGSNTYSLALAPHGKSLPSSACVFIQSVGRDDTYLKGLLEE